VRRISRVAVMTVLGGMLVLTVALAGPVQEASAVTIAPGVPGPMNILPSVVIAAKPAISSSEALAVAMLQWAKTPAFWTAAAAVQNGSTVASDVATVAAGKTAFQVPAVAAKALTKVIGPAGVVMTGWQIGTMMGNGAARLFGFKDDAVCAEQNGVLTAVAGFLNGVSCDAYKSALTTAQLNSDAVSAVSGGLVCTTDGAMCVQLVGKGSLFTGSSGNSSQYYCVAVTGSDTTGTRQFHAYWSGGTGAEAAVSQTFLPAPGCPASAHSSFATPSKPLPVTDTLVKYGCTTNAVPTCPSTTQQTTVTTQGNPTRQWRCTITTTSGASYVALSASFTETDPVFAKIVCPVIPDGLVAAHQKVEELGGTSPAVVSDTDTTPDYQSFGTTYPECASGTCQLTLTSTGGDSCFVTPGPCAGWFTDPDKATKFQCTYGTHAVTLSQCNLYSPTFDPAKVATGTPYADPVTGTTNGVQSGATSDQQTFGSSVQSPDTSRQCFPTGWAVFNPVEWVMKPVQCAMQWAFVPPSTAVTDAQTGVQQKWRASTPGKLAVALTTFAFLTPSSGCQGLAVPMPTPDAAGHAVIHTVYFLPSCPGDFFYPWAVPMSIFIGGSVCVAGFFTAKRLLGSLVGYGEAS
jgi:hypothetical protein